MRLSRAWGMILMLLLVIPAGIASGCAEESSPKAVKIGAIYPLSGSLATSGADVTNGVLLAVEIINNEYSLDLPLAASRGIDSLDGAEVAVIFGDSQGSPSKGRAEAERLIDEEKVVALIGCYQSAVTAEASEVAEDRGIPFVTAMSTAPSLTQRGLEWFFRTTPNEKTFVHNFCEFLQDVEEKNGVEADKLAIVCENSIWGAEVSKYAEQYAKEYGYQIVERVSYSADAPDVADDVQRLKDAQPNVVIQASYIRDAITYMQAYKATAFDVDAILANDAGFVEPEFLETLGADGDYIFTREVWSKDLAATKPIVGAIDQLFRERYGRGMNGNSARAFTGMVVLADAINRAASTEAGAIHSALLQTCIPGD
ncbi:MAG: ABC transporter substrate-binding protein, partial [Dehalococcoidia bacterium]|nr:ABC transporter substrate-binding protein [Dehalococcoidia bacterium]